MENQNISSVTGKRRTKADSAYLFRTDLTSTSLSASNCGDVCIDVTEWIRKSEIKGGKYDRLTK